MIDKAVDHAPRACAHIVWHVHVLRMFTEREQEELVNKISWRKDPGENLFGICQSTLSPGRQVRYSLTKY